MNIKHMRATSENIAFNLILIPEEENARHNLTQIDELANSIKVNGLLTSLTVVNGGPEGQPYRLAAGFRRAAALKLLKWGSALVPVTVVDSEDIGVKNLIENIHREALPSVDTAERLRLLEGGEAPGSPNAYSKKVLAERLSMSISHVSNLIRADKNLSAESKQVWRKKDVPTTVVFGWAKLDETEQEKAVAKWLREQERAESKEVKSKATGKGSEEGEGEGASAEVSKALLKGAKAKKVERYRDILEWKLQTGVIKATAEKNAAVAQIDTIRFLLGDLKKFPLVTASDEKAYDNAMEEDSSSEEEEGGEES